MCADNGLAKKVDEARRIGKDTNRRVRRVEGRVGAGPLAKRLSGFALVMLLVYLLALIFIQARDNGDATANLGKSLRTITDDNGRLTFNNQTLLIENQRLNREKAALIAIVYRQGDTLRRNGLPAVDPFDPSQTGGVKITPSNPEPTRTARPTKTASPRPSGGSSARPTPRPTPRPTYKPAPSPKPTPKPAPSICAPGLPCIPSPTLPPLPPVPSFGPGTMSYPLVNVSLKESAVEPINFISYDAATVSRLLAFLVPLFVALITKKWASSGLKGFLNLMSSAVVGSVTYLVSVDGGYDWRGFVNATLNVFVVSVISYYGVLKPTGLSDTIAAKTRSFGLGKPEMETEDKAA